MLTPAVRARHLPPATDEPTDGPTDLPRLFVVGCPRSGTTLVQSFLAAHRDVHGFPETHFFYRLPAARGPRRWLGLVAADLVPDLGDVARHLGRPDTRWPRPRTVRRTVEAFTRTADEVARDAGRRTWSEKTPADLYAVDLIERLVPRARFVHVVRDGAEVVASLCAVAPGWGSSYTVDTALDTWRECVAITAAHHGRPGHAVIRYADLVTEPDRVLRGVCQQVGLPWDADMVDGRARAAPGLIKDFEHWKSDNTGPLQHRPRERFEQLFDVPTRRHVEQRVAAVAVPEPSA